MQLECFKCGGEIQYQVFGHNHYILYVFRDLKISLHVQCTPTFFRDGDYKDYDALHYWYKQRRLNGTKRP